MLVAITGATGFVGRHLASLFLRRGHRVRALVRDLPRARFLESQGAELVPGSLDDGAALALLLDGADAAVHLVGIIVERGAATFTAVHVDGTRRVLDAARVAGVRRFIHMSALGARADERATPYHRTKWHAEELVRDSGIAAAILRPSFISGPQPQINGAPGGFEGGERFPPRRRRRPHGPRPEGMAAPVTPGDDFNPGNE